MSKHADLGTMILGALEGRYPLEKQDIGADARLSKSGMVFETESYAVKGLGHLCVLRMKAFLGLMKMETVVLAVKEKDLPLFNLDWVSAAGKVVAAGYGTAQISVRSNNGAFSENVTVTVAVPLDNGVTLPVCSSTVTTDSSVEYQRSSLREVSTGVNCGVRVRVSSGVRKVNSLTANANPSRGTSRTTVTRHISLTVPSGDATVISASGSILRSLDAADIPAATPPITIAFTSPFPLP